MVGTIIMATVILAAIGLIIWVNKKPPGTGNAHEISTGMKLL